MSEATPNEEMSADEGEAFDFQSLSSHMTDSVGNSINQNDVQLDHYLAAYEELQNFFILLGAAFQFVATDVKSKIKILRGYQKENSSRASSGNFSTVQKMIQFEVDNKLLESPKYVSGSRTLLRLHRGLDFVRKFLAEVYRLDNNAKLGSHARGVYNQTLAEHHGFIIRNTARASMQFLPTRIELLRKISNNSEQKMNEMLNTFPRALRAMDTAYERIQALYSSYGLLDLP